MNPFDIINEDFEHKFTKQNPRMLQNMFGSNELSPFWIADMDFKVADPITQEIKRIADRGIYAYEFDPGSIYRAIIDWNIERHLLSLDKNSFIQITGVLTGISILIRELSQPGDGVLIQAPVFHQFARVIKASKRKIVNNPLQIVKGRYQMDFEDLERKLETGQVKIILLCNPHNPVGRVWTRAELQQLADIANKYKVLIISDEIHSDIIYPGHSFNSIMSLDQDKHIALLGAPAKTFGMQSISQGYIYVPDEQIRKQIKEVVGGMYLGHGNAFTTFATYKRQYKM